MNDELDDEVVERPPAPWGAEITPLTEVCGGQYVLLHEIARGDLSIVYRAKPAGSRDVIAFKLVQPRYLGDEAQVRRFRREAELLKRIEHPNVVRLIDNGTIEDGRDFLALELLTGRTLAETLAEAARMSPERTCRIARQIGRALRAMHKVGVIHRDLRPENILLIGPEDAERVKLIDFSDAGDVGAPARRVRDPLAPGTSGPHDQSYRAPEQVRKRPPHASMDVFALGVIMYEMLAGEHPFVKPKTDGAPKLGAHTIRTKAFDAPEVLLGLVADCIERDPEERPRAMDDVLERIDKALLWMGVVPHEGTTDEADEDRRTQLWAAAEGQGGVTKTKVPARAPLEEPAGAKERPWRDADPVRAETEATNVRADDDFAFDLEDDAAETIPTQRRVERPEAKSRKPWETAPKTDVGAERRAAAEAARRAREEEEEQARAKEAARRAREAEEEARAQEAARRARDEEEKVRAQEAAQRAREEARRAKEEARRAQEEARRAQEEARRAQEEARRERARREGPSTGSVPRIDLDELHDRERASRDGPSSGSVPRIDLDDLGRDEWSSRDSSSSDSMPRIDPDSQDDGAPTGPRYVVDTVAWTKQQPSAEPGKARKSRIPADEPPRASTSSREASVGATAGASAADSRSQPRPRTAAHDPVDALPRWLPMLLVMVILAGLAYAVFMVWTS